MKLIDRIMVIPATQRSVPPSVPISSKTRMEALLAVVSAHNQPNVVVPLAAPSMKKISETINLPLVTMPSVPEAKRVNTVSQYLSHSILI